MENRYQTRIRSKTRKLGDIMKERKIPLRTCVVTKMQYPKKELIRIVATKDKEVFVDSTGKKNGRGAYLLLDKKVIDEAKKTKALDKKLEIEINDSIYEELYSLLQNKNTNNKKYE